MIHSNSMLIKWVHRPAEDKKNVFEWKLINRGGFERNAGKWKDVIDKAVEDEELHKWKK